MPLGSCRRAGYSLRVPLERAPILEMPAILEKTPFLPPSAVTMTPLFVSSTFLNLLLLSVVFLPIFSPYSLREGEDICLILSAASFPTSSYYLFLFLKSLQGRQIAGGRKNIFYYSGLAFICIGSFFAAIFLISFWVNFLLSPFSEMFSSCQREYISPSRNKTLVIRQSCMFDCRQPQAHLNQFIFQKDIGKIDLGNIGDCVFIENSNLKWNSAEDRVEWQIKTPSGVKKGVIQL